MCTSARLQGIPGLGAHRVFSPRKHGINGVQHILSCCTQGRTDVDCLLDFGIIHQSPSAVKYASIKSEEWREGCWNWKMGEIFSLAEWTLMSPHSLLLCRGRGHGMAYVGMSCSGWENTTNHPCILDNTQMCHHCVTASLGTPAKGHSPHSGCRRLKCPLVYLFLHPSSFRGPHNPSATYLNQVLSKEAHGGALLAPLQAVPHPSLQSGAPFASHGSQVTLECGAAQLTRQLAHPHGRPARKTSFLVMILEKKSFLDFCLRCDTLCSRLSWLEMWDAPERSQLGETSGELGCRESFITPPTPAGCQVRETQPEHEQLFLTDVAEVLWSSNSCLAVLTEEISDFPLNLAWELPAEPGHSREREKLKTPHRITTQDGLWS